MKKYIYPIFAALSALLLLSACQEEKEVVVKKPVLKVVSSDVIFGVEGGQGTIVVEADAAAKFRTWEWNCGHSPVASFQVRRKVSCGTIEAAFSLKNGRIDGLHFSGDFLGNLPSDGIERILQDCRYTRDDLLNALKDVRVGACFDSLSSEELTDLLLGG